MLASNLTCGHLNFLTDPGVRRWRAALIIVTASDLASPSSSPSRQHNVLEVSHNRASGQVLLHCSQRDVAEILLLACHLITRCLGAFTKSLRALMVITVGKYTLNIPGQCRQLETGTKYVSVYRERVCTYPL